MNIAEAQELLNIFDKLAMDIPIAYAHRADPHAPMQGGTSTIRVMDRAGFIAAVVMVDSMRATVSASGVKP